MKLVKEILYEKFEEHSDPVADLGIGGFSFEDELRTILNKFDYKKEINFAEFFSNPKIQEYWQKRLEDWFLGKKVTGLFAKGNRDSMGGYIKQTTGKIIRIENKEFWDASDDPYEFDMLDFALITSEPGMWQLPAYWDKPDEVWYYHSFRDIRKRGLPVGEKIFINEKFIEKSDPIADMGIGATRQIINGLWKLSKQPGVGSINLKHSGGLTYLEIWHYFFNDDKREIIDLVKFHVGEEYFKLIGIEQGNVISRVTCRAIIKPEYEEVFEKAFTKEGFIKESVNEKFTEKSDPIHDLGIGTEEMVKLFKKELNDEWPTLTKEQEHFQYHAKEKFIRIDTWPLSMQGMYHLRKALKKIYPKYKDVLKITRWPSYKHVERGIGTNRDGIIRIR